VRVGGKWEMENEVGQGEGKASQLCAGVGAMNENENRTNENERRDDAGVLQWPKSTCCRLAN